MSTIVTPDTFAVYLGVTLSSTDEDRVQMLIDDAIEEALTIVTVGTVPEGGATEDNLPAIAAGVIRAAVKREFNNPSGATQEVLGSYSIARPASSGSMFSKAERAKLRRGAGGGSAFSIDLLQVGYPDTAFES